MNGLLGSLCGFLLGAGVVFVLLQPGARGSTPRDEGFSLALSKALFELSNQVEAMKEASLAASMADQAPIERSSHSSSNSPDLSRRLQGLESVLVQLTEALGDIAKSSSRQGNSSLPLVVHGGPVDWEALVAFRNVEETKVTLQHFGWSFQKLLNTYGAPTNINDSQRGVEWAYVDSSDSDIITFLFRDGAITETQIYD